MAVIRGAYGRQRFYVTINVGGAIGKAMDDSRVTDVIGCYPTNELQERFSMTRTLVLKPGASFRVAVRDQPSGSWGQSS